MDLSRAVWRKSTRSSGSGNCVEVATNLRDGVAVRDTKDRDGGTLVFAVPVWQAFVEGLNSGSFDRS